MSSFGSTATSSPSEPTPARHLAFCSPGPESARFWITHAALPLAAFAALILALSAADIDTVLASQFYEPHDARWLGSGVWWANALLHDGGRWFVRLIAFAALLTWATSYARMDARHLRRPAAYLTLSIVLATGLVGALKAITNIDCPWDLALYGGDRPLLGLLAHRPDHLPHAQCFPGAHSSSGFSLLCLYFLLRERGGAAWLGLGAGAALGALFSFAQQARGAHFLSHDLWSALICWLVVLGLYHPVLRPRATRR